LEQPSVENSRRQILEQMVAENPSNAFARYGLAMEFVKGEQWEPAVREFETLLAGQPDYAAAYFHGGQTLEKMGRIEQAREWYRRGVEAARDPHARSELQAALDILGE
jgi:tetratricopeptide (TPR) repeat protein